MFLLTLNFLCVVFTSSNGYKNRIVGVMVRGIISSAVDYGFEPQSGQTKEYEIGICCFFARSIKEKEERLIGWESG